MGVLTEGMVKSLVAYYMYTFMLHYNNQLSGDQFPFRQAITQEQVNTTYLEGPVSLFDKDAGWVTLSERVGV
jgi:hypothetical protein